VEVHAEGLAEVRGSTVIGSNDTEREVDAIILGTGFQVTDFPGMKVVHGREGRALRLMARRGTAARHFHALARIASRIVEAIAGRGLWRDAEPASQPVLTGAWEPADKGRARRRGLRQRAGR